MTTAALPDDDGGDESSRPSGDGEGGGSEGGGAAVGFDATATITDVDVVELFGDDTGDAPTDALPAVLPAPDTGGREG